MQTEKPNNAVADEPTQEIIDLVVAGKECLARGDLEAALEKFEQVVESFPSQPEGHNNLGALYTSLGKFDKAEACFSQVLCILPDNTNINYNRGVSRLRQQKYDAACDDFKAVLEANPHDADAINNLGVASYLKGQIDTARDYFQQALAEKPDFPNAVLNLCDLEQTCDQPQAAIALCGRYLEQYDDFEIKVRHFEMLHQQSRQSLEQACRAAESLVKEVGDDQTMRQHLGNLIKAREALPPLEVDTPQSAVDNLD